MSSVSQKKDTSTEGGATTSDTSDVEPIDVSFLTMGEYQ